tara:strand:- start:39437 stop:39577 length:141 start_codon:yes stop_codon:yes gene_type:complete
MDRLEMKYVSHAGGEEITIYISASTHNDMHHFYHPITGEYIVQKIN